MAGVTRFCDWDHKTVATQDGASTTGSNRLREVLCAKLFHSKYPGGDFELSIASSLLYLAFCPAHLNAFSDSIKN